MVSDGLIVPPSMTRARRPPRRTNPGKTSELRRRARCAHGSHRRMPSKIAWPTWNLYAH